MLNGYLNMVRPSVTEMLVRKVNHWQRDLQNQWTSDPILSELIVFQHPSPFKHSGNCENSLTALSSSQQAAVQPVPAPSVSSLNCLGLCPVFVCFLNGVITSISPTNDNNFIFGSPTYSCWRCSMNVILYLDMYVDKYSVEVFVYNLPNNMWYSACLNIKGIIFNISHI